MLTVTLDTNTLGLVSVLEVLGDAEADLTTTTVTAREVEGTKWAEHVKTLKLTTEDFVLGESRLGEARLGDPETAKRYEQLLSLLSGGGFPKAGQRGSLTDGQKRLQRDAMILSAHARDGRDIFVSNDTKAIGQPGSGLRRRLQERFGIRAMTLEEFKDHCASLR